MQQHYRPDLIEPAVQQYWAENKVFKAIKDTSKEKYYCLSTVSYTHLTLPTICSV